MKVLPSYPFAGLQHIARTIISDHLMLHSILQYVTALHMLRALDRFGEGLHYRYMDIWIGFHPRLVGSLHEARPRV